MLKEIICTTRCTYNGVFYDVGDKAHVAVCDPTPRHFTSKEDDPVLGKDLPKARVKRLLVLGDAPCLLADVDALGLKKPFDVMAVNRAAFRWVRRGLGVDFWVSVHADSLAEWRLMWSRVGVGKTPHFIVHTTTPYIPDASIVSLVDDGGSGYIALRAAGLMDYKQIFVAGMPLQGDYQRFAGGIARIVSALRKEGREVVFASGALKE